MALVSGDYQAADLVERACLAYARAASFDPASVGAAMLEELKGVLTPAQIVELAAVVGMWKMINTIHDTLHLPIEPGLPDAAGLIAAAKA
jgi:alkylhydroperoxidase family enzyme